MRNLYNIIFTICLLVPAQLYAETPIVFSDVSAGVFRFQIKLAEQGNPEAQYKVGEMHEMGNGVKKDLTVAQTWYEKSAAQGHKKSKYKLLYLEIQNNGLNDYTKSQLGVLRQESVSGNADAQYFLGKMYAAGVGVPKSLNNALTWLNKATFNGVTEAEHEAIAVEEELVRIREKEAKKRVNALEATNKKKLEEEKAKQARKKKDLEKKRKADAAAVARRKAKREADNKRASSDSRKRIDEDKKAAEMAARQKQAEAKAAAAAKSTASKKSSSNNDKQSFEADPCKDKKKARFLSTCR